MHKGRLKTATQWSGTLANCELKLNQEGGAEEFKGARIYI